MCRRRASSLAALLALACASGAPAALTEVERSTIEREVTAAMDSLLAAAMRRDADAVFGRFAPGPHADDGALATRDELERVYRPLYASTARLDLRMSRREVRVLSPDVAMVVAEGTFDATGRDGARQQGRNAWTFVWERAPDGWRVLHQHQSSPR